FEEPTRAIIRTPLGGHLRRTRERREPIGREPATSDLTLVDVDDLRDLGRERRETREQDLRFTRRHARKRTLAMLNRLDGGNARCDLHFGLTNHLGRAPSARLLLDKQIVRDAKRIEILKRNRELLELLRERAIRPTRPRELHGHARRISLTLD